jgi:uncharacterized damage-inducible protein DinB
MLMSNPEYSMLIMMRRLSQHLAWADDLVLAALEAAPTPPPDAVREYAHILGADEVWLSRLEQRLAATTPWPEFELSELRPFARQLHAGYARYLASITDADLARNVLYTNSAGQSFETRVEDILVHVSLHAQYHRGKVNLLLRQAGLTPAPADFIGFVRGAPAAIAPAP